MHHSSILHLLQFAQANIEQILVKLKQLGAGMREEIERKTQTGTLGSMPFQNFRAALQTLAQGQLTEHEVITVARYYQDRHDDTPNEGALLGIAQDHLKKAYFENFSQILEHCKHIDQARLV